MSSTFQWQTLPPSYEPLPLLHVSGKVTYLGSFLVSTLLSVCVRDCHRVSVLNVPCSTMFLLLVWLVWILTMKSYETWHAIRALTCLVALLCGTSGRQKPCFVDILLCCTVTPSLRLQIWNGRADPGASLSCLIHSGFLLLLLLFSMFFICNWMIEAVAVIFY